LNSAMDSHAAAGSVERASVEIDAGAATVRVSGSSELGGDLYRAHIEYSGQKPQVDFNRANGSLRISQGSPSFLRSRQFALTLQLSPGVPWSMTANTGATTETINLAGIHLSSLTLNTGASHDEITLGSPSGTVPLTINGGSLTVHLHRPSGIAASVRVSGGALSLNADGRQMHAIGNLTYESAGYASATDGYQVEINGGACNVTLDTAASS
jgi:hypothetical protein